MKLIQLGDTDLFERYKEDFQECFFPLLEDEVAAIPMLNKHSCDYLWKFDQVKNDLLEFRKSAESEKNDRQFRFQKTVLNERETRSLPRVFIRYLSQLTPSLYENVDMFLCEMLYDKIEKSSFRDDILYSKSYFRGLKWFDSLSIDNNSNVFVASDTSITFYVKWDFFKKHWDAFYVDSFTILNIFSLSFDWFLFLDQERICMYQSSLGISINYADYSKDKLIINTKYGAAKSECDKFWNNIIKK